MITLNIPGKPKSKTNYKAQNKAGCYFNPTAVYEGDVRNHAKAQLNEQGIHEQSLPLFGKMPVAVYMRIYVKSRAGDIDNYPKSILDALKGVLYANDKQVKSLNLALDESGEEPDGVVICCEPVE